MPTKSLDADADVKAIARAISDYASETGQCPHEVLDQLIEWCKQFYGDPPRFSPAPSTPMAAQSVEAPCSQGAGTPDLLQVLFSRLAVEGEPELLAHVWLNGFYVRARVVGASVHDGVQWVQLLDDEGAFEWPAKWVKLLVDAKGGAA